MKSRTRHVAYPRIGSRIDCDVGHITYLNSDVPIIRVKLVDTVWSALPITEKSGFIIFLKFLPATMSGVRILRIHGMSAFGEPL